MKTADFVIGSARELIKAFDTKMGNKAKALRVDLLREHLRIMDLKEVENVEDNNISAAKTTIEEPNANTHEVEYLISQLAIAVDSNNNRDIIRIHESLSDYELTPGQLAHVEYLLN